MAPVVPQEASGQGAVGAPFGGEGPEVRGFRAGIQAAEMGEGGGEGEVAGGEDIGAFEGEQEVDLGGPGAEAAHGRDRGDGGVIAHRGEARVVEAAIGIGLGQGAGMGNLGAGEAGTTQGRLIEREEAGGGEGTGEGSEAFPDGAGGGVADLLAHDCLQQSGKSRGPPAPRQWPGGALDAREFGVPGSQFIKSGTGGRRGGMIAHGSVGALDCYRLQQDLRNRGGMG